MKKVRNLPECAAFLSLFLVSGLPLCAQGWERRGPEGGMVLSLAASPDGTVYLGTSDGHVFASEDGAAQWELRGRAGTRTDAIVAQLAADPREPRRVFAAIWFREEGAGGGVFRSEDGGVTWSASGLSGEAVRVLELAPSRPGIVVAGARSGVFRSNDSGKTWERISPQGDPELRNVDSLAIGPGDAAVIYAGTYHLPWKTSDGGKTWAPVAAGLIDDSDIMSMRVDAANPARMYLSACSGIYRSENRGGGWTKLQGIPYAARRTQEIVQDPRNPATLYAATTEGLWVTRDAGESWERTTRRDWVVNAAVVAPEHGGRAARLLIGTEKFGILASDDSGKTFAPANRGFTHQVVKQLAGDPLDPEHVLLLLPNSAAPVLESRDSGKSWKSLPITSGTQTGKDRWNAEEIERIYGSPWGWLAQLPDASLWIYSEETQDWRRWKVGYVSAGKPTGKKAGVLKGTWHTAAPDGASVAFSKEDAYLAGSQGLLRCARSGKCQRLAAFSGVTRTAAIWASADGKLLAVAEAAAGKLGVSRDGGDSAVWNNLPDDLPTTTWILWSPEDGAPLYLGTKGGLFVSRDAGKSWTLSKDGLPATFVEKALRGEDFFLVTLAQGGVYRSASGGANWKRQDGDAERGRVAGMTEVGPGEVLVGSQSEGVLYWRSSEK